MQIRLRYRHEPGERSLRLGPTMLNTRLVRFLERRGSPTVHNADCLGPIGRGLGLLLLDYRERLRQALQPKSLKGLPRSVRVGIP